jgi:hypothetical protein
MAASKSVTVSGAVSSAYSAPINWPGEDGHLQASGTLDDSYWTVFRLKPGIDPKTQPLTLSSYQELHSDGRIVAADITAGDNSKEFTCPPTLLVLALIANGGSDVTSTAEIAANSIERDNRVRAIGSTAVS